jgi:hypothetical protein
MTALEEVLGVESPDVDPRCAVVHQRRFKPALRHLRDAIERANAGDMVVYAIPLDTPMLQRVAAMLAMRYQLRRVARTFARAGGRVIGTFGVEPNLEAAAVIFELDTAASRYADRCLRPRGRARLARRSVAWLCGYDPALGGLVVVGRKS